MTAKLLTAMSSLTETENKNINIQTTKQNQKKKNKKQMKTTKKLKKHTHPPTQKKNTVRALQPDIPPGYSTN